MILRLNEEGTHLYSTETKEHITDVGETQEYLHEYRKYTVRNTLFQYPMSEDTDSEVTRLYDGKESVGILIRNSVDVDYYIDYAFYIDAQDGIGLYLHQALVGTVKVTDNTKRVHIHNIQSELTEEEGTGYLLYNLDVYGMSDDFSLEADEYSTLVVVSMSDTGTLRRLAEKLWKVMGNNVEPSEVLNTTFSTYNLCWGMQMFVAPQMRVQGIVTLYFENSDDLREIDLRGIVFEKSSYKGASDLGNFKNLDFNTYYTGSETILLVRIAEFMDTIDVDIGDLPSYAKVVISCAESLQMLEEDYLLAVCTEGNQTVTVDYGL